MPVPKHCPLSRPCSRHAPPAPGAVISDPWPNRLASGDPLPCSLPSPPSKYWPRLSPTGSKTSVPGAARARLPTPLLL